MIIAELRGKLSDRIAEKEDILTSKLRWRQPIGLIFNVVGGPEK